MTEKNEEPKEIEEKFQRKYQKTKRKHTHTQIKMSKFHLHDLHTVFHDIFTTIMRDDSCCSILQMREISHVKRFSQGFIAC